MLWKKKLLIIFLLLAVAFLLSFTFLLNLFSHQRLEEACGDFFSRQTGMVIRVGKIQPGFFNQIILKDVTVQAKGSKDIFAQAPELKLSYSWWPLLTNWGHLPQSIQKVTVVQPLIYLERNQEGQWNYEQLLLQKNKSRRLSSDWLTKLQIQRGQILVRDRQGQIKTSHFQEVKGWVSLRENPQLVFALQAREGKTTFSFAGKSNTFSKQLDAQLAVADLALEDWRKLLPQRPWLQVQAGQVTGKIQVKGYYPDYLSYQGRVMVSKGQVKSSKVPLPIGKIEGQISLNSHTLHLNHLHGFIGQTPVQLTGNIYLTKKTLVDLDLQSPAIKVEELGAKWFPSLKAIKNAKALRGNLTFLGPTNKLQIQGNFTLASGKIYGQPVKNAQIAVVYENKHYQVKQASAQWQGGYLKAQGLVTSPGLKYQLTLVGQGVPVQALPLEKKYLTGLTGKVDGTLLLRGAGKDWSKLKVGGVVNLTAGSWQKMAISKAQAKFSWQKGRLDLPYLVVQGRSISGRAWGRMDRNSALQVNLAYLDLASLAQTFVPSVALQGKGSWQGTVANNSQGLQLRGQLFASKGQLFGQDFSQLTGTISLKDKKVQLQDICLQDGVTRHFLNGQVVLNGPLDLTLTSDRAKVEKLLRLVNWQQNDLQGIVNSTVHLTGSPKNLLAQGEMEVTQGSWQEEALDKARINFHWQNNTFYLDKLEAQQDQALLMAQGWLKKNGSGELNINGQQIDLEQIPYLRYKLPSDAKTVNLLGRISFRNLKEIRLNPLLVVHGKNSYRLQGMLNLKEEQPTMNLTATIEQGDLTLLAALIPAQFPHAITGQIQGKVNLRGNLANPKTRAIIDLKEGQIGQYPVQSGKMHFLWQNDTLSILQFKLNQGEGVLAAQGNINLKGKANVDLMAQGLEGKILSKLFNLPETLEGTVDLTAQIRGQTSNVQVAYSLDVQGGKFRETTFDRLYGLGTWQKNILSIESLTLQKEKYKLVAQGVLPTAANSAQPMNLNIQMKDGDLGLLTLLVPEQIALAQGPAQAWLKIGGTRKAPLLQGEITVNEGKIQPKVLLEPIEKLRGHIIFHQNGLDLEYLEGWLGGGNFTAFGKGEKLFTPFSNLDFHFTAKNLAPKSKIFQGILNGELTLTGSQSKPTLAGQIALSQGLVELPKQMAGVAGLNSPLLLDIGVNIGDNLRVKSLMTDLYLQGGLHAGGSLSSPQLLGKLVAKKGTINYLDNKFRLTKGLIEFKEQDGIMPSLDLEGKTRFHRTTILLQVTGFPNDIKAHFVADPSMTEREILILLTLGHPLEDNQEGGLGREKIDLDKEVFRLAGESISLGFVQELEENLGNSLGLDELYISQSLWKGPQITLGKSLFQDKMYVNYTLNTNVDSGKKASEQEEKWYLEAQYKLPHNLSLDYTRNNLGESQLMMTRSFRF